MARSSGSDVLVDPKTGVASSGSVSVKDLKEKWFGQPTWLPQMK